MSLSRPTALGLDFGTESIRALLVALDGTELGCAVVRYRHGQILKRLPTWPANSDRTLPPDYALQHPDDWLKAAGRATRSALRQAGAVGTDVIGLGVDFTSCTMMPALRDGAPLCLVERFREEPLAWPKLWKHHAAKAQTQRLNTVAARRREPWLPRYGGIIGLEWFFPKILETLEDAPDVYDATEVWLEGGDWLVWQLTGVDAPDGPPRSTCQAGYKAMWNAQAGYPSSAFFKALHPRMAHVVRDKMPGRLLPPGEPAGALCPAMARQLGLAEGTPVSAAVIDAHAGVPGAGVGEAGTLVMVMGTSSCHMLNARVEQLVPGVAGVVAGGILPGYYGYETGQAAVGDSFDWFRQIVGRKGFDAMDRTAADVPPGADGVLCMDWFNGCRTPLMDGTLTGAFTGLTLNHRTEHLYRAVLEASALGLRWIVEVLRDGGVPVRRFVATGGLPHHSRLLRQIYADVLGSRITVHPSSQGPALGAAILGVLAASKHATGFASPGAAIAAMAKPDPGIPGREPIVVKPNRSAARTYDKVYQRYRALAAELAG